MQPIAFSPGPRVCSQCYVPERGTVISFHLPRWERRNAYLETFISRFGDELFKRKLLTSLLEPKVLVEEYRRHYNQEKPHSASSDRTLARFAVLGDAFKGM
jgi:transposase InsO family protein